MNDIEQPSYHHYFNVGGEMAQLTRSFDWETTVLGSPAHWPEGLLTTVNMILNSRFPMFLWWGPHLIQFYNDAFRPSLGKNGKHPKALGQKGEECWPEVWPVIKPLIDQVMSGGMATWSQDQLIPIYRNGKMEDVYWTFSYSKIDDGAGKPAGVLVICNETTDLVEKIKAKEDSKNADERYQILFTSSPLSKWIYDLETLSILDVNEAALDKYGYTRDEFLSMNARDLRPEEEIPKFLAAQKSLQSSIGTEYPGIFVHQKKDKTKLTVAISTNRLSFQNTNCVLVVGNDITENLYYNELDKLENYILDINNQQAITISDLLNTYLAGIEELHPGMLCSILQLKGKQLFCLASPSLPKEYLAAIEGREIGINAGSCGTAAFTKRKVIVTDIANDERWQDYKDIAALYELKACWSTPIINSDNNVMATFANYFKEKRSPTEREENTIKRACRILQFILESLQREQSLREINEKYYYATEATSDAIWDWDLLAETMAWGQGYKAIFGYDEKEFTEAKQSIANNIHPDDMDRVFKGLNHAINGQQTIWKDEYRYMKSDKTYADVIDKGIIIRDANGKATRMVGAMQDITRMKREEQMLTLLNDKLREISWIQSHIVRAPLTRIMGLIPLIKDAGMSEQERIEALEYILISANELDVVIKNITQMSALN